MNDRKLDGTALSLPGQKTIILKGMNDTQVKAVDAYVEKKFSEIKADPVGEREVYKHGADPEALKKDPRTKVPVAEILKDQSAYLKQLIRSDITGINLAELDIPIGNKKTHQKLMDQDNEAKVKAVTDKYLGELIKNAPAVQSGSIPNRQQSSEHHR